MLKRFQSPNLKPLTERIYLAKTNQNPEQGQIEIKITLEERPIFKNDLKILPSRRAKTLLGEQHLAVEDTKFDIIHDTKFNITLKDRSSVKKFKTR